MNLSKEVDYRLARWVFANLHHQGKIDEGTYHKMLDRLIDVCDPPMKSIEMRFEDYERKDS